jgi:L-threonylcarbamoyladenylate synthase
VDGELQARIREAAAALRRGGLVAYPTETFYGLGALAMDPVAVARLARAKGRPDGKPLPLLAGDLQAVEAVAVVDDAARRIAARLWPGPLTLVLPARPGLPDAVTAGTGTVGIRVPGGEVARALAREAGGAVVATSANPSGGPPPRRASELDPALRAGLDLVLDGGETPGGLASTVVAVEGGVVRVLRPGPIPAEAIEAALHTPEH